MDVVLAGGGGRDPGQGPARAPPRRRGAARRRMGAMEWSRGPDRRVTPVGDRPVPAHHGRLVCVGVSRARSGLRRSDDLPGVAPARDHGGRGRIGARSPVLHAAGALPLESGPLEPVRLRRLLARLRASGRQSR